MSKPCQRNQTLFQFTINWQRRRQIINTQIDTKSKLNIYPQQKCSNSINSRDSTMEFSHIYTIDIDQTKRLVNILSQRGLTRYLSIRRSLQQIPFAARLIHVIQLSGVAKTHMPSTVQRTRHLAEPNDGQHKDRRSQNKGVQPSNVDESPCFFVVLGWWADTRDRKLAAS